MASNKPALPDDTHGGDVITLTEVDHAINSAACVQRYGAKVGNYLVALVNPTTNATVAIMERILDATDPTGVLDAMGELGDVESYTDRAVTVTDAAFQWGTKGDPGSVYAVVTARVTEPDFITGEKVEATVKFSCGGAQVVIALARFREQGALPMPLVFRRTRQATAAGFHPYFLETIR